MTSIKQAAQSPAPGALVELFRLDAMSIGGGVYCFTRSSLHGAPIRFGGVVYTPVDIEVEGFEWNGAGTLPTPKIRVSNADRMVGSIANEYGDLLGASVMRIRTFGRFLDGEPEADPNAYFPLDLYKVERKVSQNKVFVEWELSASMDQEGRMLPGRQVLRDACTHRYRRFNPLTGTFDYSKATCPYSAGACFTANGAATTASLDVCGKRLTDCKARFGEATLPTRAFPGVSRLRL